MSDPAGFVLPIRFSPSSSRSDYADNFINGALTELGGQRTITAKSA